MPKRLMLRWGIAGLMCLAFGCAGGVQRAPIDSIPEDTDPDTRIDLLEEMKLKYENDGRLYYEIGNYYYDKVMPTEARMNYEKAIAVEPDLNRARVNLAMLLMESDESDSARALLEEAIRRDPNDAKAYNNLGMVYYSEKKVDKAIRYFERAIELEPDNVEARYNIGLAFAEAGLLLEAMREWQALIDMAPEGEVTERARMSLERVEQQMRNQARK